MKILYLGDAHPLKTSIHRADALRRLGHDVYHVDPHASIPSKRWAISLGVRTGFRLWLPIINSHVRRTVGSHVFDLLWVDCGAEVSPKLLCSLKAGGALAINYNHDDPFGARDGRKWDQYRSCLPEYDLVVVVREENIAEAQALGACRVARVFRPYDPVAHTPLVLSEAERQQWASEVVFVGAWMPERGPFMIRLLELGVPLTILGSDWDKDPAYARLRPAIRGGPVYGQDYVKAIQCAKVALGLLSKGNRDLHTTRSAEVPFIGGAVFCAERTTEHVAMFREGEQALFWSSPEECAEACKMILTDSDRRDRMAAAARERIQKLCLSNDAVMAWALNQINSTNGSMVRTLSAEPILSR